MVEVIQLWLKKYNFSNDFAVPRAVNSRSQLTPAPGLGLELEPGWPWRVKGRVFTRAGSHASLILL